MEAIVSELPSVRERIHQLVMRRMARFYWISRATSGAPASLVAAALVSRLALEDLDFGRNRRIAVKQKDLARLTTLSRSAAAIGLAGLSEDPVIAWGDGPGAVRKRSPGARRASTRATRLPRLANPRERAADREPG